jgi:hypothetical protein
MATGEQKMRVFMGRKVGRCNGLVRETGRRLPAAKNTDYDFQQCAFALVRDLTIAFLKTNKQRRHCCFQYYDSC